MSGEFDFIDWIRAQYRAHKLVRVGPGDDLAVLSWPGDELLLVGVDQVLDGVHFSSSEHTPKQIGRKVMNRNLSDCAAMACLPVAAVATVALPAGSGIELARELYSGMRQAADAFDCMVVGGDTASWDQRLAMTVTILGRSAGVEPVTRSGARPGNRIYVTGALGGSRLGRHMDFTPRIVEARKLASTGNVTAMIDISDGLSRDLRHICQQSSVGAIIEAEKIPIHADAAELSKRDGVSALDHALHDGEDHELLLTSRGDLDAICIGQIIEGSAIQLQTNDTLIPLEPRGWEHKL